LLDHAFAIGVEDSVRTVDVRNPSCLQCLKVLKNVGTLAHEKDAPGQGESRGHDLVGGLEGDREAARLQVLGRQPKDLGVVALSAGRMLVFTEDTPVGCGIRRASSRTHGCGSTRARASTRATSAASSTSTTVG